MGFKHPGDAKFMALFKLEVDGKVLSGHPIVTSTGNTLRVLAYLKFLEFKMQKEFPGLKLFPG